MMIPRIRPFVRVLFLGLFLGLLVGAGLMASVPRLWAGPPASAERPSPDIVQTIKFLKDQKLDVWVTLQMGRTFRGKVTRMSPTTILLTQPREMACPIGSMDGTCDWTQFEMVIALPAIVSLGYRAFDK